MSAPVQVGPSPTSGGPVPSLTPIELLVLDRIAAGLTRKEISLETSYTFDGVSKICNRILRKLGARNQPHAVLLACRAGVLDGRPRSQRHGDHGGYTQHQKRGEEACTACKAGERAYQVDRRRRRREERLGSSQLNAA